MISFNSAPKTYSCFYYFAYVFEHSLARSTTWNSAPFYLSFPQHQHRYNSAEPHRGDPSAAPHSGSAASPQPFPPPARRRGGSRCLPAAPGNGCRGPCRHSNVSPRLRPEWRWRGPARLVQGKVWPPQAWGAGLEPSFNPLHLKKVNGDSHRGSCICGLPRTHSF